jgi:hypothetical protein
VTRNNHLTEKAKLPHPECWSGEIRNLNYINEVNLDLENRKLGRINNALIHNSKQDMMLLSLNPNN